MPSVKTFSLALTRMSFLCALLFAWDVHAAPPPSQHVLATQGTQFTVDGKATFLYGISYYGALAAPEEIVHRDFADMKRCGFNWIRMWANWRAFGANAAAVDEEGRSISAG